MKRTPESGPSCRPPRICIFRNAVMTRATTCLQSSATGQLQAPRRPVTLPDSPCSTATVQTYGATPDPRTRPVSLVGLCRRPISVTAPAAAYLVARENVPGSVNPIRLSRAIVACFSLSTGNSPMSNDESAVIAGRLHDVHWVGAFSGGRRLPTLRGGHPNAAQAGRRVRESASFVERGFVGS